ncbi:hypothetical protein RND71_036788 [Anisodus tanguticus]|uniref:Uncharacterized protein n=1 Tax=Anisodus tanguticus TaxID=243964 RepID=A0AAE1R151_9SOLA|nr:hypothetical protein RND71_036788 [Anisodus tanguticus]
MVKDRRVFRGPAKIKKVVDINQNKFNVLQEEQQDTEDNIEKSGPNQRISEGSDDEQRRLPDQPCVGNVEEMHKSGVPEKA